MSNSEQALPPLLNSRTDNRAILAKCPRAISGAKWLYWIAGLSAVNSAIVHFGGGTSFVVGLGFTLIADHFFREMLPIALLIDTVTIGVIAALGYFSLRGHLWAMIAGAFLYVLDALIYLYFQDWMPLAFHCYALFFMIIGAVDFCKAKKAHKEELVGASAFRSSDTA
ncbi:hypothetical protein [Nibricoccus sp. IMCC34717]|uniref:hypothetical protein n=1 Tax=Nibricoccus sp. IMCC34717 TaxID=3034021 RepID=UPI003850B5C5